MHLIDFKKVRRFGRSSNFKGEADLVTKAESGRPRPIYQRTSEALSTTAALASAVRMYPRWLFAVHNKAGTLNGGSRPP
jgi:hypothetical protein